MKIAIIVLLCFVSLFAIACSSADLTKLEGAEVTIDGKHYKVEIREVTPENPVPTSNITTADRVVQQGTIMPPQTKYALVMKDGTLYYTNTVIYLPDDKIKLTDYSTKEDALWIFYSRELTLKRIDIEAIEQLRK